MKRKYLSPIDRKYIKDIDKFTSVAHKVYRHSIDFLVSVGTPIRAVADGIVIDVKDDSNKGGSSRRYERYENFIEIRHDNEYSYYGHLKKDGALVKIGQEVKAGQIIGYTGKTGWMANVKEPHLHFMIGKYTYKTIPFKFRK